MSEPNLKNAPMMQIGETVMDICHICVMCKWSDLVFSGTGAKTLNFIMATMWTYSIFMLFLRDWPTKLLGYMSHKC